MWSQQVGLAEAALPGYPRCDDPPDLPEGSTYVATGHFQSPVCLSFCVTPSYKRSPAGAGMLTCFPSPTPIGLGLGTD